MSYYDLYDLNVDSFDGAKKIIEDSFGIKFKLHDSLYLGSYYLSKGVGGERISIKTNFDPIEGEYLEPDFQDIEILVYVNKASEKVAKEYEDKLLKIKKVSLLKRKIVSEPEKT